MAEDSAQPSCQLRRRRSSGNPNLPLNLEVGYQVNEGGPNLGTPSPGCIRFASSREPSTSSALLEFRKKQQSFEIQIEECEEEEIVIDSDEETEPGTPAPLADRAVTPTPIQDFGANVVYTEAEECVEIAIDSDEETEPGTPAPLADRAVTPTPIQDFGANVVYTEGPQVSDFLKVNTLEQDCLTDVEDADSEVEGEE